MSVQPNQTNLMPPQMHWAVVLILSFITFGLAGWIWAVKQAAFVKKLEVASKALMLLYVSMAGMVLEVFLSFAVIASPSRAASLSGLMMLLNLAVGVAVLIAVFSMRASLVRHYNTVEPIQLRLGGVMTFFFSILYFQYHFSRIAAWKKTGRLD